MRNVAYIFESFVAMILKYETICVFPSVVWGSVNDHDSCAFFCACQAEVSEIVIVFQSWILSVTIDFYVCLRAPSSSAFYAPLH